MSNIYDIVLCSFDITNGNVIEHSINGHFTSDNSNISFKAMPDNCHVLDSLYNIIRVDHEHYGISYFKKINTSDVAQRNSVFKALIIVTNQLNLTLVLKDKLKLTMDLILREEREEREEKEEGKDVNVKESKNMKEVINEKVEEDMTVKVNVKVHDAMNGIHEYAKDMNEAETNKINKDEINKPESNVSKDEINKDDINDGGEKDTNEAESKDMNEAEVNEAESKDMNEDEINDDGEKDKNEAEINENGEKDTNKDEIKTLLSSLYQNLNMIYRDDVYLDYIDNQIVDYNLEHFLAICREVDVLALFKLFLLEKRVVFYTEDISLLETLVFLQVALFSLYPNLLNTFSSSEKDNNESNGSAESDSFNVLDVMSKYRFLKLPLDFLGEKGHWEPYLTIDEIENFINAQNRSKPFIIGLGNSLFLNHKQLGGGRRTPSIDVHESERLDDKDGAVGDEDGAVGDKNGSLGDKNGSLGDKSTHHIRQRKKESNEKETELVHYDVAFRLTAGDKGKSPKLELDYCAKDFSFESVKSSPQDARFMSIVMKQAANFETTNAKDRFIRRQFENYLVDMLFFIKLYYYKEFVKLTSLDYEELKEKKTKRGETQIEKNSRKNMLKNFEMILSESEHNKIDLNIKKQFDSFGGKSFFKHWFQTSNYKAFMQSTDERLFDIEMNETLEFAMSRDSHSENKWLALLNGRFWSVEHPVYSLETILAKREEETGSQWKLAFPEMKMPEVKLGEMSFLGMPDVNAMFAESKLREMMAWKGGLFPPQKKLGRAKEAESKNISKEEGKEEESSGSVKEKEEEESSGSVKEEESNVSVKEEDSNVSVKEDESEDSVKEADGKSASDESAPASSIKNTFFTAWNKITRTE